MYLNDERVDANASAKFLMTEDCEYTLKVVDNQNSETVEQSKISFHVIPPKPRINLNSVSGILANPGDEMEIETNATAPGGFEPSLRQSSQTRKDACGRTARTCGRFTRSQLSTKSMLP